MGEVITATIRPEGSAEPEKKEERAAWLPEKFNSPEELAAAYSELEKKQGSSGAPLTMKEPTTEEAQKKVAEAGLDFNALAAEVAQNGTLSEESLKTLEGKGIPRNVAESFIEGQKLKAERLTSALAEAAGGKDELSAMVKWGAANYSKEELAAYNKAVQSGDAALARLAVEGLKARYTGAVGKDGQRIIGAGAGGSTGVSPFESAAQMVEAMRDPRYQKDAAYRRSVEARVKVSQRFFGG